MTRLKTRAQLEQERIDAQRYALGNITLNTEKLLLIYSAMEQRDGLLARAEVLGWTHKHQWILYV